MDNRLRLICRELRKMTSSQAADWIIETYPLDNPRYGEAFRLISHRSWKRADQIRLAAYYFQNIPYANPEGYEAFASFMSVRVLVKITQENLPIDKRKNDLLLYYLLPVLKKAAKTESDHELIKSLIANLDSGDMRYMAWYNKEIAGSHQ
ncbi:MAG: hypothetical protein FWG40_03410 [Peptococcaceae bacterium]|nr:hypothetical protein [Peptococcaceae bacterium]